MTVKEPSAAPAARASAALSRVLVTLLAGAAVGLVGTFAHRMGASTTIPYGLILAFAIVGLSTWSARARCGAAGVAWHLIACSLVAWLIAARSFGNGTLTPIGFSGDLPYFSQHAGYIWLYGQILWQGAFLLMPARWFRDAPTDGGR